MSNPAGSSPFIPSSSSVTKVMMTVVLALLPGIVLYIWLFGWGILTNLILTTTFALLFEWLMLLIRDRPVKEFLFDGSAIVTALLLGLTLPTLVPWWIPVLGAFFAIVVAKHLYGGLGYNTFNPAMAAYAVLLISFPLEMSLWSAPLVSQPETLGLLESVQYSFTGSLPTGLEFDALTSATMLDHVRTEVGLGKAVDTIEQADVFGYVGAAGFEWVNAAFLLGGLWLVYKKIISWHIPVMLMASLALISGACFLIDGSQFINPLIHLFSGATMLGAFFIATDPVTAPTTSLGRIIYAAGIGLLIYIIRIWGGYPDGVAFAVLLIGLTVPLLDYYTAPKVYGARAKYEKS